MSKLFPKFLLFVLFLTEIIFMPSCTISETTKVDEQRILLKFKQILGNPPVLEYWQPSTSPCDWPKIICSHGTVTSIRLGGQNISTALPRIICDLPNLSEIDLSFNFIPGNFPDFLCSCKKLNFLDLSLNNFVGPIPDDVQCLSELEHLNLGYNNFDSIPKAIGQLQKLKSLWIPRNSFKVIPALEIGNLSNLEELSLPYNPFSPGEVPKEFAGLMKLKNLSMKQTNLIGEVPEFIVSNLSNLRNLDLSDNQLTGFIPGDLHKLHNLEFLDLSNNQLSGLVPDEYKNELDRYSFQYNSKLCSDNKILQLPKCSSCKRKIHIIIYIVTSVVTFILAIVLFVYSLAEKYYQQQRKQHHNNSGPEWEFICFHKLNFTESDILSSLSENNLIGRGGSGKVYLIVINATGEKVAVKKVWNEKKLDQGLEKEFLAEVQILGMIRHSNIVKLLCCISCETSKLLVYEYMENQSLDRWLYRKARSTTSEFSHERTPQVVLDWPTRLSIAIGAAQGLCYMHHGCTPSIIHRDVKSSNILLDSNFKAKIADFGLAKVLVKKGEPETASVVAGTFGYIAPEYAYTTKVNVKSDIYSFGVVLLELSTGRAPVIADEQISLIEWSWRQYEEKNAITNALDEDIKETYYLETMIAVFKLGLKCTSPSPSQRPSMNEILQILLSCATNFASSEETSVVISFH